MLTDVSSSGLARALLFCAVMLFLCSIFCAETYSGTFVFFCGPAASISCQGLVAHQAPLPLEEFLVPRLQCRLPSLTAYLSPSPQRKQEVACTLTCTASTRKRTQGSQEPGMATDEAESFMQIKVTIRG